MPEPPVVTATFLFTDVQGSVELWERHRQSMADAMACHDAILRASIESHSGLVVKTTGDGFHAAFPQATDATAAALEAQVALLHADWGELGSLRVRMGLHSGEAQRRDRDYYGLTLNRAARLMALAHGGQILVSMATEELVRDSLPPGASLRDLGEYPLRDLIRPERVFELLSPELPEAFPPLRIHDTYPTNLPLQLTSFVGREREMAEVKRLLRATRLLTLTGTGGCGKTRLALKVAADVLDEYPDGVWVVELATVSDPTLVTQTAAQALGVRSESGRPVLSVLTEYLRSRCLLLVLDNCEHLLEATAELVNALLRACPRLVVLATSREMLGTAGEVAWRVPSLSAPPADGTPSVESLAKYEAVRLFAERAVAVQPAFTVTAEHARAVAQICWRLDGIPLAIELAAARTRGMTVEQIVARLNDRFRLLTGGNRTGVRRQQTLRAAIDWSYDLLTSAERVVLRRLAVFAGGCTLEAAEAVCAGSGAEASVDAADVLDLLLRLVDRSLVVAEEQGEDTRYRLLETVRQYAGEKLLESGDAPVVRARHRDRYLALAERACPGMRGPEQRAWLNRLEADHDNLRAALEWSQADPDGADAELRLASSLAHFWRWRGYMAEGRGRIMAALARAPRLASPARVLALIWVGRMELAFTNASTARCLAQESVTLARELGDEFLIAWALRHLAYVYISDQDWSSAMPLMVESLSHARRSGDPHELSHGLVMVGNLRLRDGDLESARELVQDAMDAARAAGDPWTAQQCFNAFAAIATHDGDLARARLMAEESLARLREIDARNGLMGPLVNLGTLALHQGDWTDARTRLVEALDIARRAGDSLALGGVVHALASLELATGKTKRGVRLFAAAGVRSGIYEMYWSPKANRWNPDAARAALGHEAFARAWAEGEAMTLDEAVVYALAGASDA